MTTIIHVKQSTVLYNSLSIGTSVVNCILSGLNNITLVFEIHYSALELMSKE